MAVLHTLRRPGQGQHLGPVPLEVDLGPSRMGGQDLVDGGRIGPAEHGIGVGKLGQHRAAGRVPHHPYARAHDTQPDVGLVGDRLA